MQPPSDQLADVEPQSGPGGVGLRERDDRLAALKQLVGHLAHDFNNCLVPLVGYVTLLKEEPKVGTRVDQYLSKLDVSVRKTEAYLAGILEATHPERHFSPKQVDLAALIQRAIETHLQSAPSKRPITVEAKLDPCTLWLDEVQWTKVIDQLVSNAECALRRHGTLRVILKKIILSPEESARLDVRPGNSVELVLDDSGQGMPPEVLKRAYDPFFTTRSDAGTGGLGLTYVHSVVRLHGGQLDIASAEETGTRVRIWLPDDEMSSPA